MPSVAERIKILKEKFKDKFDGCTGAPNFDFVDCCDEHDYDYLTQRKPRKVADKDFRLCIMRRGSKPVKWPLAWFYWAGVRMFGWYFWKRKHNASIQYRLLFGDSPPGN